MGFPAFLHGEWITLLFNVLCGLAAGQLRSLAQDKEDVWSFSPFIDLSIYRWIRNLPKPRFDWQIMFFASHHRSALSAQRTHARLSALYVQPGSFNLWVEVQIATSNHVVFETKIFNGVRIQMKLERTAPAPSSSAHGSYKNQIQPALPL